MLYDRQGGDHVARDPRIDAVESYLTDLQNQICASLETLEDAARFGADQWQRPEGGGGRSRVLESGEVLEKAGVNYSHITGERLPATATARRPELTDCRFEALGLSVIVHPRNPSAPTTHANLRCFMAHVPDGEAVWWFGGGFDLTPCYGFEEDALHWHAVAKAACDPFGADLYARYKQWCDEYFYLPHRNETRGIGGLFFDDLQLQDFATTFAFVRSVGDHFLPAYRPILIRRKEMPHSERQREFQLYRRGRYVEFNLVYDRGTLFGLQSRGRIESILVSLPPCASWRYDWHPAPNSEEARLCRDFLRPRDWLGELSDAES